MKCQGDGGRAKGGGERERETEEGRCDKERVRETKTK